MRNVSVVSVPSLAESCVRVFVSSHCASHRSGKLSSASISEISANSSDTREKKRTKHVPTYG